jgi:predicted nuclease of predicted toxin-antitoxin system
VAEDSQARAQLNLLRADGHDVVSIGELAKNGTADPEVLDRAQRLRRVLLTHNAEDFHELHLKRPGHQGIIAVYRDADPRKNMNHTQIAAAIQRLETLQVTVAGDFQVLSHWLRIIALTRVARFDDALHERFALSELLERHELIGRVCLRDVSRAANDARDSHLLKQTRLGTIGNLANTVVVR